MEKAKQAAAQLEQAAANIDQQLNESVGVETPAAKKPAVVAGAAAATGDDGNVWNDDDFKFDDDDDEEQVIAAPPAPAVAPPLAVEEPPSKMPATPAPPKTEEPATDDNAEPSAADASAEEETIPLVEPPTKEKEMPADPETVPSTPASAFGALGGKLNSMKPNEINFMSPMSSLMSSITKDQDQQQQQQDDNDDDDGQQQAEEATDNNENVPETPMKEEATPVPKDDGAGAAAWQEDEDIVFDDEEVDASKIETNGENEVAKESQTTTEEPAKDSAPEQNEEEITPPVVPKVEEEEEESEPDLVVVPPAPAIVEPDPADIPVEIQPVAEPKKEEPFVPAAAPATTPVETAPTATPQESTSVPNEELEKLKNLLSQREEQLAAKAEQMFQLQQMYEKEKQDLSKKLADTKEEAKKRILKARERCEAAENKLQASTSALTDDAAETAKVVAALREEGGKLAHKQSEMEKLVRTARGEARELREKLEYETATKEDALETIEKLKADLKETQDNLSAARKGETQAGKLDHELQLAREENSLKANTIMSLEQSVKELKASNKELSIEVDAAREGAVVESERESKKLRKEHNTVISDLEAKLQTTEKEAAVREDSLRLEVEELRKRWQDAVRRADGAFLIVVHFAIHLPQYIPILTVFFIYLALSMDVQSSTAPLLRQLESMERQHRARASAAAELETKLRSELEETVIQHEKLTKEHSEMKVKNSRLERQTKEQESDLSERQKAIEEFTDKITLLEGKLEKLQTETNKKKEEYAEVERLANEGVSKVRSEMSQAVLDSEERYRSQLDTMKEELRIEQEKRTQLEQQLDQLLENAAAIIPSTSNEYVKKETKPVSLRESEGQADILESALLGLGGESGDENDDTDDEDAPLPTPNLHKQTSAASFSSYAALESLTQNLRAAREELESLRARLQESEKVRESLLEDLNDCREAAGKLPLFEQKVKDLILENKEKSAELQGLQDDIDEVKEMYRTQMNVLLEEKAAAFEEVAKAYASRNPATAVKKEEPMPELVEDMF